MASSETRNYSLSPKNTVKSWLEKFHIVSPPLSAAVIFLETGVAPKGSGIVEDRPMAEFDMSEQPIEGQMYLWHGQGGALREVTVFTPASFAKVAAEQHIKDIVTAADEPMPSRNLVLGLNMARAGASGGGRK